MAKSSPGSRRPLVIVLYTSEREIAPEVTRIRADLSSEGCEQGPDLVFDVRRVGHRAGDLVAEDLAVERMPAGRTPLGQGLAGRGAGAIARGDDLAPSRRRERGIR